MTCVRYLALATLVTLAACADDDQQCLAYDRAGAVAPAYQLRDPQSGVCQPYGGGYDCHNPCEPCPAAGAAIAQPDWAVCYGSCEALDESTCQATSGCRAVYVGSTFEACWATAPSGPVQGGSCSGLGAQECSRHDDCIAVHAAGSPIGQFQSCAPETSIQDPGSCVGNVTCAMAAPACPANTIAGRR